MSANQWQTWEEAVSWLVAQPGQQSLVKECYFDSPLEQAAERYWTSREWGAIRDLLPPHRGVAIDIGAGRGITSYALASDGWTVTAIEPDPSREVGAGAIRRLAASQRLPITVIEDFGENIPCPQSLSTWYSPDKPCTMPRICPHFAGKPSASSNLAVYSSLCAIM